MLQACRSLLMSPNALGELALSPMRVAFWVSFVLAMADWGVGKDIPQTLSSFLLALIASIVGHGAVSAVTMAVKGPVEEEQEKTPVVDVLLKGNSTFLRH